MRRFLAVLSFLLLPLLLGCVAAPGDSPPSRAPRVEYRIRFEPAALDPRWDVTLVATGLDPSDRSLVLELADWGEWTRVDGYHLRGLTSVPPLARRGHSKKEFVLDYPESWDGTLRVEYSIPVLDLASNARSAHGLLPYRTPTYAFGFSSNTLMSVAWDGMPEEIARTIEFDVPGECTVATGYGIRRGPGMLSMPPSIGNTVISIGRPVATGRSDDGAVEIVQWGGEADVCAPLLAFARSYVGAVTRSLDMPPTGPVRLFVTEPGMGGVRVDGAIGIGCPTSLAADSDEGADPHTLHFLAHEIFHDWLGGRLVASEGGERLAWFWEGFTEYLSLYHLAREGLVGRDFFARRLLDHEGALRNNGRRSQVALADPDVNWREPEIEPIAYGGSALVAFGTDVALRRAGRSGLAQMMRDFLALPGGRYDRDTIRDWLSSHGAAATWAARYEAPIDSDVASDLEAIGYVPEPLPAPLTYVGVALDREGPFGAVVAVDPDGPAAESVRVGDVVTGLTPVRSDPPEIGPAVATRFRFGLETYDPNAERVRVDVERGGERIEIWLRPRPIEGGIRNGFTSDDARLDAFFRR